MNCMEGIRGFCEPSGGFVWRFCDLSGLWCSDRVRGRKKIIVIYPIRCMRLGNYYKGKVVSNNETKYNILHPLYYTDIYAINYSVYICIVHNISKITNTKIGFTIYNKTHSKHFHGLRGAGVHRDFSSSVCSFIMGGVRCRKLLILGASMLPAKIPGC